MFVDDKERFGSHGVNYAVDVHLTQNSFRASTYAKLQNMH